ncbi:helix-turn-helix domain-containing protein [Vibrio parahaemolyticus]|uniref:helix-turn-helix domain-containing protein n=1 Tax=Vibrio TaxID=662 RepID=UPI0004454460|nr:hypothetical protein AJ90_19500 [Vibrio parahaemolyticus M0605]
MTPIADMHRIDIVAALHKKGLTVQDLSVEAGWSKGTLANALRRPWPKGEKVIAKALGMEPQDIWPSRYQEVA